MVGLIYSIVNWCIANKPPPIKINNSKYIIINKGSKIGEAVASMPARKSSFLFLRFNFLLKKVYIINPTPTQKVTVKKISNINLIYLYT
jgi:hypothetical protein